MRRCSGRKPARLAKDVGQPWPSRTVGPGPYRGDGDKKLQQQICTGLLRKVLSQRSGKRQMLKRADELTDAGRLVDGRNVPLGVTLVVCSSLLFAIGGAATKLLSPAVPPTSGLIWRNIICALGFAAWLAVTGWPGIRSNRIDLHVVRGLATFGGLWAYFVAVAYIPLSTAVLLRTASPVFVPLVAYVLYRRHSDRFVWAGSWIGLVGVALVVGPDDLMLDFGAMLGIASGILGALGAVLIWRLGSIDGLRTQLAWLTAVGLACSLAVAPWYLTWPLPRDWLLLIVMAVTATVSQVILMHAFTVAPADKTITWAYLSVVFGGVFGVLFWSEIPTAAAIAGTGLMVAGSCISSRRSRPQSG
jgi:drug/metabolite transporter (DMT)-like permease